LDLPVGMILVAKEMQPLLSSIIMAGCFSTRDRSLIKCQRNMTSRFAAHSALYPASIVDKVDVGYNLEPHAITTPQISITKPVRDLAS
jgi:hypothetical protein